MDPQAQFCHNPDCPARGQRGLGNIHVHSRMERRYRCSACDRTFAATHGTPLYRLKKPTELVIIVLTLLSHGCPLQAIVASSSTSIGSSKGRSSWAMSRPTSCTSRRSAGGSGWPWRWPSRRGSGWAG